MLNLSDNTLNGATEEIQSDVTEGGSRIPSIPENGTESSSGQLSSEWNVPDETSEMSEQDMLIASILQSDWEVVDSVDTDMYTIGMGNSAKKWHLLKYFPETPSEYQHFKDVQFNSMQFDFALNQFVKLTFDIMGSNNPTRYDSASGAGIDVTKTPLGAVNHTKSFLTKEGAIKIGTSATAWSSLTECIQCPAFTLSINNNKERTDSLFQTEATEYSDGKFVVEGSFDIWKADSLGMSIANDAKDGADKRISIKVQRTVGSSTYSYEIQLEAHLRPATEAKDGNKYKVTVPFSVNVDNGIKIIKKIA